LLGYDPKRCIVTGIVTGGWVCIIPSLLHLFVLNDVPIKLWLMVLPGVYVGASVAPAVHDKVGIINVLGAFGIFLFLAENMATKLALLPPVTKMPSPFLYPA